MKRARILIADDHKMFAQGLMGLLEEEFELVGTVPNGQVLLEEAQRLKPDLLLVDISMPVLNGLDAVRQLSLKQTGLKVIFLTMHADTRLLAEAMRCGASGYVLKQSAGEDLIHGIREVLAGNKYITSSLSAEFEQQHRGRSEERTRMNLTPRQREVLRLISEGFTMKQIAVRMGISTRTAESYKYDMMSDLGVESTAELVQYAIKLGLGKD